MPPETRSQDARRVDETTNLEQPQAYDHIQQQLNDTRADANTRFRELKEAMDALVSRVDTTLQKTQLSSGECSLPKAPQFPPPRDSPARFNWINEGTPPQYQLRRPDQNESFLFLRERMSLNGFISVTSTLMWKKLLSKTSSN